MVTRLAMVVSVLLATGSACAESLSPDAARRFVAGKLFVFNCFDGTDQVRSGGKQGTDGPELSHIHSSTQHPRDPHLSACHAENSGDIRRKVLRAK
jgi:hypothetical protein